MNQLQVAKTLDRLSVEAAHLRRDETVPAPFLDLVQQAVDGLQADNSRLHTSLTNLKQGLLYLLEQSNA